jgi:hypothetical protein
LQNNAITNVKVLYIVAYFNDLTYDFVTGIGVSMAGEGGRCDTKVTIDVDHLQVTATNPSQVVTHAHPIWRR